MVRKQGLRALLCGYLLVFAVACATGSPSPQPSAVSSPHLTSTAAVQPSAPSLPPGTVLYQANWAQGLTQWQVSGGWKVMQGQLEVDANSLATLIIPYRPPVADYEIEVRLQIVRLLLKNGGSWTIFASKQPGKDGYQAGVSALQGKEPRPFGSHGQAQVFLDPISAMSARTGIPIDYDSDFQWHTYRVEVQGNGVRLLQDGVQIGYASSEDTNTLSNGPLGLNCSLVVLHVRSIRMLSL